MEEWRRDPQAINPAETSSENSFRAPASVVVDCPWYLKQARGGSIEEDVVKVAWECAGTVSFVQHMYLPPAPLPIREALLMWDTVSHGVHTSRANLRQIFHCLCSRRLLRCSRAQSG